MVALMHMVGPSVFKDVNTEDETNTQVKGGLVTMQKKRIKIQYIV